MIYWRRAKRTRLHDSMRTISDSWYRASDELQCMHGFGTELIRNLAIWLAVSQDYHLFIYKVYWYILSMFVPIFTSFGIENVSLHSGRPRKLLPLISLSYFFLFHDPRVSTRGIASIDYNGNDKIYISSVWLSWMHCLGHHPLCHPAWPRIFRQACLTKHKWTPDYKLMKL